MKVDPNSLSFLKPDAALFKDNQPFLIQVADGLLECFLADAEKIGDYFRPGFISDRDKTAPSL